MTITTPCQHCGEQHVGVCHRIRAVEYRADGTISRIEYHAIEGLQAPVHEHKLLTDGELAEVRRRFEAIYRP